MSKISPPSQELLSTLAKPSSAYTRRAWLAMGGLAAFMLLYFGLAAWFLLTAYRLSFGSGNTSNNAFWGWVVALCSTLLAVFMLKGFFFIRRGGDSGALEITAAQQPRLFEFLNKLADEAGAPRAHRVYLSARVNAAVFYDLSIINLFFPSKKNLEIGLGLVNVLNRGELKAVLAHEFGHFAQRAMAVGRWVYIAQQIAANLVARRDAWDKFLNAWSQLDFRIAWVAWSLRLVVWAIRSLVDTAFSLVVMIQRALSREMEMQADLVAVSLTGSDALIHALHLLQSADDSWGRAASFAMDEKARDRVTPDLFALQSYLMEKMALLLNDANYAKVPPLPTIQTEGHRVFKAEMARPPQMWLTHPLNHEREENAKRHYVAAVIDDGCAWEMFDEVHSLREQVTAKFMDADASKLVSNEELLKALDIQFNREHLKSQYRGVYYGRSPVRAAVRCADLVDENRVFVMEDLDLLYPESLRRAIEQRGQLEKELEQMRAIHAGYLQANQGRISLRGREIKRNELPQVLKELEQELAQVEGSLSEHDRLCRSVHFAAAKQVQHGWPNYLQALLSLMHYADHTANNIRDAHGYLNNVIAVETATSKVTDAGVQRIIDTANSLFYILRDVYAEADQVKLDHIVRQRLEVASWVEALGEFKLCSATRETINQWLEVINSWVDQTANFCSALRLHALEQLLISESVIARNIRSGKEMLPAPEASVVPAQYELLLPGKERQRQTKLAWWARFQTADGILPAVARFGVAGCIVGAVLGFGGVVGKADLTVYNGLDRVVVVTVANSKVTVGALANTTFQIEPNKRVQVQTNTLEGELIESFEEEVKGTFSHFVYNVAAASPLIEWTNAYGNAASRPERNLGAPRWTSSSVDVFFAEPPASVSSKTGGATRDILTGFGGESATVQLSLLKDTKQQQHAMEMHARWDGTSSHRILEWFAASQAQEHFLEWLETRLKRAPKDTILLRMLEDTVNADQRPQVCARIKALAQAEAKNIDLHYLSDRCIDNDLERNNAFDRGHQRWPDNVWYAYAAAYNEAERQEWESALKNLATVYRNLPTMRSSIAMDQMRLTRLLQKDTPETMRALAGDERLLQNVLAIELAAPSESNEVLAYQALYRGELEKAVSLASKTPESMARIVRLAAASTGAKESLRKKAINLSAEEGIDANTVWAAVGLALKEKRDFEMYLQVVKQMPVAMESGVRTFINKLKARDLIGAESALQGFDPEYRAQLYSLGVVFLGQDAPQKWRETAKRTLFTTERPYFS